jgi:hypothetical protein
MPAKLFCFEVTVETDKATGDILAVYFRVRRGKSVKVVEMADGNAFADYNSRGQLLGIELLGPCEVKVLDRMTRKEPKEVRDFVRGAALREMVPA